MNTTLPGQIAPTQTDVLSLIATDEDDMFWPFEIADPPEEDSMEFPEPDDLLDISDYFQADVTCMKLIYLQDRMNEIEALYQQELNHLNYWKDQRTGIIQRQYDWLCKSLESWLMTSNQKTANLPHGTLQFRKQLVRVEVLDEQAIIDAGISVRIKKSPDKSAIKRHFIKTGEIIDGVEIIEPEPKFSIKLNPGKEHARVLTENPPTVG